MMEQLLLLEHNDNTQDEINCWKDIMAVAAGWHTSRVKKKMEQWFLLEITIRENVMSVTGEI